MSLKDLTNRALEVRKLYEAYETQQTGRPWTRQEFALGYVSNVGDLMRAVATMEGLRRPGDMDAETSLRYELSDNLWSIIVLAALYNIDLEDSFMKTMDHLQNWVGERLKKSEVSE